MAYIGRDPIPKDIGDIANVDTDTVEPVSNDVLKFNGTDWVPAQGAGSGLDADTVDGLQANDFATAAQGSLADTAVQPGDDADALGSGDANANTVLLADGTGGAAWSTPNVTIFSSGGASDGQVLAADGLGGAAFETLTAADVNALALTGGTITGALTVEGALRSEAVSVNAQTGTTYTLVASDAGKLVTLTNSSAITLTVPPESSVNFATGATIAIAQLGAGTVSVAEGSGVTVSSLGDATDLADENATASLVKVGSDSWLLVGALA